MSTEHEAARRAEAYAALAVDTAAKLKPGTWEAVRALAELSIAQSLIAQRGGGSAD
ncbi:hypothetical protein [Microbacterium hominis]|uniref:Uncharacterized protein n=1 Tax=Microbacterium hominis TaxID=162426 RepID=A0A7D4PNL6_9MICO|nr:hypothetical protein [Microbacterium hominis]QKJ20375.1 hypothetical protein HQM25_14065 [Microbacterium hominis]